MCGSGVVDANEVGGVSVVLLQSLSYGYGEAETLVAVCLCLGAEHVVGHVAQAVGETVVSGDVYLCPVEEGDKRNSDPREPIVLFGSLVAGVGEVEDIVLLLRIEHQRVLVAFSPHFHNPVAYLLASAFLHCCACGTLLVLCGEFGAQNGECLVEILFFQHCGRVGKERYEQQCYNGYASEKCIIFHPCGDYCH